MESVSKKRLARIHLVIVETIVLLPLACAPFQSALPLPAFLSAERQLGSFSGSIFSLLFLSAMILLAVSMPFLWRIERRLGIIALATIVFLMVAPTLLVTSVKKRRMHNSEQNTETHRRGDAESSG